MSTTTTASIHRSSNSKLLMDTSGDGDLSREGDDTIDLNDDEDALNQSRFTILSTPPRLPLTMRSFSDDSERKSIDEEDYPSMLMNSSSDDESVQELLERANAVKSGSQTKLQTKATTSTTPNTAPINHSSEDDDVDDTMLSATKEGKSRSQQLFEPFRRNLWPSPKDQQVDSGGGNGGGNGSESDGKSQGSHVYVGDMDHYDADNDDRPNESLNHEVDDDGKVVKTEEQIARAESLARDVQSAILWLQEHRADAKGVTSSEGEDDDEEVLNNCLDSLQQLHQQQDEQQEVLFAEQKPRDLQKTATSWTQQMPIIEDHHHVSIGDDDDEDGEVNQYFSILDALHPPSVANKLPPSSDQTPSTTPSTTDQARSMDTGKRGLSQQTVEDRTSVTEGLDDMDFAASEHFRSKLPMTQQHRRIWICLGVLIAISIVAIIVGVAIGVTSENSTSGALSSGAILKSGGTSAPTISVPITLTAPSPSEFIPTKSPSQSNISLSTALIRINAGSATGLTDSQGQQWQPDQSFSGGYEYRFDNLQQNVGNTDDQELFLTQRFGGQFIYSLPLPSYVIYQVDLYFAELDVDAFVIGRRIMDVKVERVAILRNYDIFRSVGAFNATIQRFFVPVVDGALTLLFTGTSSNATIAALEVRATSLSFSQVQLTEAPTQAP